MGHQLKQDFLGGSTVFQLDIQLTIKSAFLCLLKYGNKEIQHSGQLSKHNLCMNISNTWR